MRRLATFWWDFLVGDDWRLAVGVLTAIGATVLLQRAGLDPWWLLPSAVALLLMRSVWRASRGST
jgi:hypothetical protein